MVDETIKSNDEQYEFNNLKKNLIIFLVKLKKLLMIIILYKKKIVM